MSDTEEPRAISKRGAWLLCLFVSGMGLFIVLLAAGVISAEERSFEAPRWVVGAAGVAFVLVGLVFVTMSPAWPGVPAGQHTLWSLLIVGSIAGLLALIFNWIAFGPGERHFSGTVAVALPFFGISSWTSEWIGRLVFGAPAISMDLFFVWATVRGIRQLLRRRRERAGH